MSSPSSSLGDPREWGGPDSHGHLWVWGPAGCWLPTPPLGTASASRTRISKTTTSRPGRWTIAVIGLRRGESHPVLQLMRLGCSGYATPQWRDWRSGGPQAAGESRTPKGAFTGRVPDPFWRQRQAPATPEYPPRNPRRAPAAYIPLGHHARWCRSRRAVVGSVRLTGPSRGPRFSSMLRRHSFRRGRRRAELHRDLRFE